MRYLLASSLLLTAMLVGCEQMDYGTNPSIPAPSPDNAATNRRDVQENLKTPIDQDESLDDVQRTAEIRSRVMKESDLSINAQNVKIITSGGKVTLRGPVKSAGERDIIGTIAAEVAGENNVDNLIDIPQGAE